MITITPQGSVYLCKTPLENDYKHQLTFTSTTTQRNYFTNSSVLKHTCTDFTYIKRDNQLIVDYPIDTIIDCNYLYYQNTGFTNKYYYCFITNMEYVNENATRITFELDVFQTYMFDITYKKSFIEREHVNDDSMFKNLVDEGLEIGQLVVASKNEYLNEYDDYCIVMGITNFPEITGDTQPAIPNDRTYNGIYSGLIYIIPSSASDASKLIYCFEDAGYSDAIVEIFMYYKTTDIESATEYTYTHVHGNTTTSAKLKFMPATTESDTVGGIPNITMPTDLDGYTPKNNKMFSSPFCFINADNNAGTVQDYKWEYFKNIYDQTLHVYTAGFTLHSAICPGGSGKAIPLDNYSQYNDTNGKYNYMYSMPLAKLPACSWLSDTYTNWLTQNGIASTGLTQSLMAIGGGAVTQNWLAIGAGAVGIYSAIKTIEEKKNAPDIVKGNTNSGDVNFAYQKSGGFTLYNMTITYDYAKRIDDYFSTYGYKVNAFKTPNVTGRTYWNYVKTIDCNLEGDIPQVYINKLKEMFNNGVTFWHSASSFLDYSQNNTIVS